jgi:hypothetical protein
MMVMLSAAERAKLAKIPTLLSCDKEGEVIAAASIAPRIVTASRASWEALLAPQLSDADDWRDLPIRCKAYVSSLNEFERGFVAGLERFPRLSEKQRDPGQDRPQAAIERVPDMNIFDQTSVLLATLASQPCWVAWQTENRTKGKKPTEVPYAPDGRKARADAPITWGIRTEAEARAAKLQKPYGLGGVGLEFHHLADGRRYGGVDLDSCRDPATGDIDDWAGEVVDLFDSYCEISPSQTGLKIFFVYDSGDLPALRAAMNGAEFGKQFKRSGGDHPPDFSDLLFMAPVPYQEIVFPGRVCATCSRRHGSRQHGTRRGNSPSRDPQRPV